MKSVTANKRGPKKWVGVFNLLEDKARIGVHWDIEFGERTEELGENKAALFQTLSEDVGVHLFDLVDVGAAMKD